LSASTPTHLTPDESGIFALQNIPLWIQSAVKLGARFVTVAASSLPVAMPYENPGDKEICCSQCGTEHPPVIDEYYFWLHYTGCFDPKDAPAPQDADLHTKGISFPQPDPNNSQIDPRTAQADPTSDWDNPTPQMLYWRQEPMMHLFWTRVHMGQLQDARRSTQGIQLKDTDVSQLKLDVQGRSFDSLAFTINDPSNSAAGFRYDIASDSVVVLPEAVAGAQPSPLDLPSNLKSALAAFPYFLYFEPGAPLVPLTTFGTSLLIAGSLKADCQYEAAAKWCQVAFDPLTRVNTWSQCPSKELSYLDHDSSFDTLFDLRDSKAALSFDSLPKMLHSSSIPKPVEHARSGLKFLLTDHAVPRIGRSRHSTSKWLELLLACNTIKI
jgi:hypothetical protein